MDGKPNTPTMDELTEFINSDGSCSITGIDPSRFVEWAEGRNWTTSAGTPVRDWRMYIRSNSFRNEIRRDDAQWPDRDDEWRELDTGSYDEDIIDLIEDHPDSSHDARLIAAAIVRAATILAE